MADFRIDRIRFRWRGDWSAGTLYVKDDVLRFGAKVYVCVEVHTSDSNFYNDLNATIPRWTQMMDGQSWTGAWQPSTFYKIGELVKVGGLIYKCIEGHTSNASATISSEPLELPVDAGSVIKPKSSLYVIAPDTIATSSRTA